VVSLAYVSQCIRCGKVRILLKAWSERTDGRGPVSRHELYVCPDKECQKVVDEKFEEMRRRKMELIEKRAAANVKRG